MIPNSDIPHHGDTAHHLTFASWVPHFILSEWVVSQLPNNVVYFFRVNHVMGSVQSIYELVL